MKRCWVAATAVCLFCVCGCGAQTRTATTAKVATTAEATTQPVTKVQIDNEGTEKATVVTLLPTPQPGEQRFRQVDLGMVLPFGGIISCDILHEVAVGEHRYYVLDVKADSRPGSQGQGRCGSGSERVVVWLEYQEPANSPKGIQALLYCSCWQGEAGNLDVEKDKIVVRSTSYAAPSTPFFTATFDRNRPDEGFVVSRKRQSP